MTFLDEGDGVYSSKGSGAVAGAFILCYFAATLGSASGIGGGGLILPIILVVGGFHFETAVILCITVVLGNTLSQVLVNLYKTHPLDETRPVIDFNLVSILLPAQIGGANVGVLFAAALPSASLMILAMLMLLSVSLKVGKKGISLYKKESEEIKKSANCGNGEFNINDNPLTVEEKGGTIVDDIPKLRLRDISTESNLSEMSRASSLIQEAKSGTRIIEINDHIPIIVSRNRLTSDPLDANARQGVSELVLPEANEVMESLEEALDFNLDVVPTTRVRSLSLDGGGLLDMKVDPKPGVLMPYGAIARTASFWIIYAMFIIAMREGTRRCSGAFWGTFATSYVPVFVSIFGGIFLTGKSQKTNPSSVLMGDVDFSTYTPFSSRTYLVPSVAFVTGILCSLLGIGGGELIGPLFLVLRLLPQVGAASTSLMSCGNAALNIIHYFFLGTLRYDWFLLCFITGLLGGVSGRRLSSFVTKTYGRPSFMVFALSLTLFMSVCLLSFRLSKEPKSHYYAVGAIC